MNKNILFVGVGGQGTILASKIFTEGLLKHGFDVKMSEVHGMAQRGGSVVTQVRYGEKVYSPLIEMGTVDIIVSFEKIEAARWIKYLKPEGRVIINDYEIRPVTVLVGGENYPEMIFSELLEEGIELKAINAYGEAERIGDLRIQNIILLGALIKACELEELNWEGILKNNIKEPFFQLNLEALKIGLEL